MRFNQVLNISVAIWLFLPSLNWAGDKGRLYVHPIMIPGFIKEFPANSFDNVLRIVFSINDKYDVTKKTSKKSTFGKKPVYTYSMESAKTLGYKMGATLVVLGTLIKDYKGNKIKLGLFDINKQKVINEIEEIILSNDTAKVEDLGGKMAFQLGGKVKSSSMGKILTWTALAGVTTAVTYLVTVQLTDPKEEANTNVSVKW